MKTFTDFDKLINSPNSFILDKLLKSKQKIIDELSTRVSYTWNGDQGPSFPSYALTTAWKTQGSEMISDLEKSLEKLYKD